VQTINFQNKSQIIRQNGAVCIKFTGKPPQNGRHPAKPTGFSRTRDLSLLATKMRFWRWMSTFYFKFFSAERGLL
jgi:hypothetical protein